MNYKESGLKSFEALSVVLILLLSLYPLYSLISHYTGGDQVAYNLLYERFASVSNARELFSVAQSTVSSYEIVSPVVLWLGSYLGIDKNLYITVLNLILLSLLVISMRCLGASWLIVLLLIFNFYLIVLFTGTERLKIAFIFALLATFGGRKFRLLMSLISILAHFQMIILLAGLFMFFNAETYLRSIKDVLASWKLDRNIVIGVFSILLICFVILFVPGLMEGLINKGTGYFRYDGFNPSEFIQFFVLAVSFIIARGAKVGFKTLVFILFFFVVIGLLGGERVNMIFFSATLFVLLAEKKLVMTRVYSWPFILVLFYLAVKSVGFVNNIYLYGNGFYRG
ncbi:hypothetical protein SAMN02927930_00482 [Pseudidiomarina indica]|uniref:EpsG family protein n=1 Tax=Pseudidiomarina indica TaxID=1159017 RepID=A0A1G6AUY3_9GAMM|nr:hypothetical protein [Pseudidiomarina indica]SDB12188.1 hypothetical protein SAMN02927930_00482 [Pseudidiomarina indica]